MLPASDPRRTAVYRLFDAAGDLLYVGISNDPPTRYTAHAFDKPWWNEVAAKVEQWFENRAMALNVESAAIVNESPRYNLAGSPSYPPKPPDDGQSMTIADFRNRMSDAVNHVRYSGKVLFLYSHGKKVAAVMPAELAEAADECGGPAAAVAMLRSQATAIDA